MIITFIQPIISLRVTKDYGLTEIQSGYILASQSFFYIIGCITVEAVFGNVSKRKLMITGSFLITCLSTMIGPSQFFNYPDNMWVMITGLCLTGFVLAFGFVPTCPEMVDCAQE